WFIMKDTYLTYINPSTYEIRFPMLVDRAFEFETGLKHTGTQHGIKVTNLQRSLVVKCKKKHEKEAWHQQLEILRERCTINGFCGDKANQFNSFVPMRENQLGYWFVNAKGYMESIAKAISNAKEEIFITDWWLSPELMLVRPSNDPLHRLDNLLGKKADEGIRIYIMIYREMSFAMGLNSAHTERVLKSKNKTNIKIIRHPRHHVTSGMQLLWSHHEKCVIIDQKIAFIGGIDLCYGRWDDDLMRLVDLGEENVRTLKSPAEIAAENLGSKKEPVEASKKIITEMAEDAGVTQSLGSEEMGANTGPRNKFEYEHPVDRKYAEANIRAKEQQRIEDERNEDSAQRHTSHWVKIQKKMMRQSSFDSDVEHETEQSTAQYPLIDVQIDTTQRFFIGKDYSNSYKKDFEFLEKYNEDYIERDKNPRMPWHDEALVVLGEVARDAARHFIQRWNIHKCELGLNDGSTPFLLPKSYDDKHELNDIDWKSFLDSTPIQVDAQ
ncbi:unnamed protein product, partial [Didymodactylos carnosus]